MADKKLKSIPSYKKAVIRKVIKSEEWNNNFKNINDVVNSNNQILEEWINEVDNHIDTLFSTIASVTGEDDFYVTNEEIDEMFNVSV